MMNLSDEPGFWRRHGWTLILVIVIILAALLYVADLPHNPPGFYIDESSISYNAHLIAQTGRDEHGQAWPLYFRAFGDYKNPVYIYLLAGIFRLTGPSIFIARLFSATLAIVAAFLIGLLGARITKQRVVGVMITLTALLTPWLFELSRVVVEVALYPLVIALFLLCVHRVSEKDEWTWADALALTTTLALLTYTYSIGRVLGPLLALGLLIFRGRVRLSSVLRTFLLYALSLAPLLVFHWRHPGALGARFRIITYITPRTSYAEDTWEFVKHYIGNLNPWRMIFTGDPNAYQIASVYGAGPVLAATFLLGLVGTCLVLRRGRPEPWWGFVLYGLAVSFVPASLTNDYSHTLRLCAVPVFLIVLTVPALAWILKQTTQVRRGLLLATVVLIFGQLTVFQWQHRASAHSTLRLRLFDVDYAATILPTAIAASGARPIYIADAVPIPGYIQAFWYATLQRVPLDRFVLLAPDAGAPAGAVVITTENTCLRCRPLFEREPYTVYLAEGAPRTPSPLPPGGFRAEIRALDCPVRLRAKQVATLHVAVRNISDVPWLAHERVAAQFQVSLGNHWLDKDGNMVVNDDGRAILLRDLPAGQEMEFELIVNAPRTGGDYILEVDMLQEGVSWFGLRGSKTWRGTIRVESGLLK